MKFNDGDIFVGTGEDDSYFQHRDSNGILLENIPIHGAIPGRSAEATDFTQLYGNLIVSVADFQTGPFSEVQMYDNNGNYVKTVARIDASDPAQQPPGYDPVFFTNFPEISNIECDDAENIYLSDFSTPNDIYIVWKYDKDGNFVAQFNILTTEDFGENNAVAIKPTNQCELISVVQRSSSSPFNSGLRAFDVCTGIQIGHRAELGPSGWRDGEFKCDGTFIIASNTNFIPTLWIYDNDWNLLSNSFIPKPTSITTNNVLGPRLHRNNKLAWFISKVGTIPGNTREVIYQINLDTMKITIEPITTTGPGAFSTHGFWCYKSPWWCTAPRFGGGWISTALIGA